MKVGQLYYFKRSGSKCRVVSVNDPFIRVEWYEFNDAPCPITVIPYHINTFSKENGVEGIHRELPNKNPNSLFTRRNNHESNI